MATFVVLHHLSVWACGYLYEFRQSNHYEYWLNESPEVNARQPLGLVEVLNELTPVCQLQLRSEKVAYSV